MLSTGKEKVAEGCMLQGKRRLGKVASYREREGWGKLLAIGKEGWERLLATEKEKDGEGC